VPGQGFALSGAPRLPQSQAATTLTPGVEFVFGYSASKAIVAKAEFLPEQVWNPLKRQTKRTRRTAPRSGLRS
jgi:hypothetical protein